MNIACNAAVSLNQILNKLQKLMNKTVKPIYKPTRAGDVKHSLADITLAEKKIGYKPLVYFDEGLERAIDWYTENLR
jgi:nucleoside-diphosphate-sugar epimerase